MRAHALLVSLVPLLVCSLMGCSKSSQPQPQAQTVGPSGGTVVSADGHVRLDFPAGALSAETPITVEPASPTASEAHALPGTTYRYGPEGIHFATPVALTVQFDRAALPAGADPTRVALVKRLADGSHIVEPGGSVDGGSVSAELPGFSVIVAVGCDLLPIYAPRGLTAVYQGSGSIQVSWNGDSRAAGYILQRAETPSQVSGCGTTVPYVPGGFQVCDGDFVTVPLPFPTQTQYLDTGLPSGAEVSYRAFAYYDCEGAQLDSDPSNVMAALVSSPAGVPGTPQNFLALAVSSDTINLAWTPDLTVVSYVLERQTGVSGPFTPLITLSQGAGPPGFYQDQYLSPATRYSYRLHGVNTAGDGAAAFATATTPGSDAGTAPPDPTGFTAAATSSSTIHLSWDVPVVGATGLILERQNAGTFIPLAQPPVTSSSYDDTGLSPSTTYDYRLRATNGSGPSQGALASATTPAPGGTGSVQVSWTLDGVDPRADGGQPCAIWGVDHVAAQIGGQGGKAACSAGTLRIDGVLPGISPLHAFLYFAGADGGQVSDQTTLSVSVSAGQLTQVIIDFHPI